MPQALSKVTRMYPPPAHLKSAGRDFWNATIRDYEVGSGPTLVHLEVASGALDRIAQCREAVAENLMIDGPDGKKIAHPLLKVENAARAAFQSAMRALRLQPK